MAGFPYTKDAYSNYARNTTRTTGRRTCDDANLSKLTLSRSCEAPSAPLQISGSRVSALLPVLH